MVFLFFKEANFRDGRIKKGSQYIQLDMEKLTNALQPAQTYEITDAYVGMSEKLPAWVIVHRLIEEQQQKRLRDRGHVMRRKKSYVKQETKKTDSPSHKEL
ncbi:hypothetical protein D1872_195110 [compost metagenome]